MRPRNLIIVAIGAVLIVACLTNPRPTAHFKAIKEAVALEKAETGSAAVDELLPSFKYDNYLVFSTATFGNKILTYGYFGRIQKTNAVEVFSEIPKQ